MKATISVQDTLELVLEALEATIDYLPEDDHQGDIDAELATKAIATLKRAIAGTGTFEDGRKGGEASPPTEARLGTSSSKQQDSPNYSLGKPVAEVVEVWNSSGVGGQGYFSLELKMVDRKKLIAGTKLYTSAPTKCVVESTTVPEGWKLVPIEPTAEMISAASMNGAEGDDLELEADYITMLSAAPEYQGER